MPVGAIGLGNGFADVVTTAFQVDAEQMELVMLNFKISSLLVASALTMAGAASIPAYVHAEPMVGGAAMYQSKNIIQNAVHSKDHTTLVTAVKAAGLVETLEGNGPFTVFAPTNEAFGKLPKGTVGKLVKPENKAALTKILTYHVVAGKMSAADLRKAISDGNGKAELTTVEGEPLTVEQKGGKLEIIDAKGGKSMITIADVDQSNGVIHVVDTVLMPN